MAGIGVFIQSVCGKQLVKSTACERNGNHHV